jgi:hypothetical protein
MRRLRPGGSTSTLRLLFSSTSSAADAGISTVYNVAVSLGGETVNTARTGLSAAAGVTVRTSIGRPFSSTRRSNGAAPPRRTAATVRSTVESVSAASPADTSSISASGATRGAPTPTV